MELPSRAGLILVGVLVAAVGAPLPPVIEPPPVLRAAGGTYQYSTVGEPPGTTTLYAWRVTKEGPQEFQFSLQGPPGWNDGRFHSWRITRSRPGTYVWKESMRSIPAVPGIYSLSAEIEGERVRARFSIAPGPVMVPPEVQVTVDEQKVIRVTWSPVPEARSYGVGFTDLQGKPRIEAFSRGKMHAFFLQVAPGRYLGRVIGYTFDFTRRISEVLVLPQQFHAVEGTAEFAMP